MKCAMALKQLIWLALLLPIAACSEQNASVPVSAINYTGQELNTFVFVDPNNDKRAAGGPSLRPYEAGGTMCCYSLPKKWRPGIKVKLMYDWWNGSSSNRDYKTLAFEVPKYAGKEPGMLWALFYEDGSVEVVSSDYDPTHAKWPGKLKHWPKPSIEYKRKLWEEEVERVRETIQNSRDMLASPNADEESKKTSTFVIERATQHLKDLEANKP